MDVDIGYNENDPEPLRNVKDIIDNYKDQIIEVASSKLAESLKRFKAIKEAVGHVLNNAD